MTPAYGQSRRVRENITIVHFPQGEPEDTGGYKHFTFHSFGVVHWDFSQRTQLRMLNGNEHGR